MIKKSIMIFAVLAMLAFGACTCWAYTASKWPVPGIPNTVFGPGSAMPGNTAYGAYGGYDGYGGYGSYGWYGYPGHYGAHGRGYYGRGWRRGGF
ncbi:hypothetical protein [Desulfomonile tiedjei]|uniref:Sulfur globule protein n=1 Tax=Desulfomonile tiedjei (strain ATCC 49306 / DSM 6799 / DCB-1) TaxID=706587 RepID=I4C6W8_DESTA|nr:hypothetical protein [Desulfomonile tiedjei]AFM25309.1 hypothetical protein Desti_2630 [Desulfomonile tiedjei DSM 6799]